MASYAKIDSTNIVIGVHVVNDADEGGSEEKGIEFLTSVHGDISPNFWKKTSFNTLRGKHNLGGTPFRKNYAGKGMTFDVTRDAFIPIKPYASFVFNETTCCWDPPVAYPSDGNIYSWNEDTVSWDQRVLNPPPPPEES